MNVNINKSIIHIKICCLISISIDSKLYQRFCFIKINRFSDILIFLKIYWSNNIVQQWIQSLLVFEIDCCTSECLTMLSVLLFDRPVKRY